MRIGELIRFNNGLYRVKRVLGEGSIKPDRTNDVKDFFGCDITLKSDGKLLFCELIPEIEYELLQRQGND